MKAKISRGGGFRGLLDYAFGKMKDAELVGGNMIGQDAKSIAAEFGAVRKMRPDIAKPVWHCSLSLPTGEHLDADKWREVTDDFVVRMGFDPATTQYVAVRHQDTDHDHVHLVVSRIGLDCKIWLGQWEARRAIQATQALELAHGLTLTPGLGAERTPVRAPTGAEINAAKRTGIEPPRVRLQRLIDEAVQGSPPAGLFMRRLVDAGVGVSTNVASTGKMNGFAFEIDGIPFKGSDLGKKYTWAGLQAKGVTYYPEIDKNLLKQFQSVDPADKRKVQADVQERREMREAAQQRREAKEAAQAAQAQREAAQAQREAAEAAQAQREAAEAAQAQREAAEAAHQIKLNKENDGRYIEKSFGKLSELGKITSNASGRAGENLSGVADSLQNADDSIGRAARAQGRGSEAAAGKAAAGRATSRFTAIADMPGMLTCTNLFNKHIFDVLVPLGPHDQLRQAQARTNHPDVQQARAGVAPAVGSQTPSPAPARLRNASAEEWAEAKAQRLARKSPPIDQSKQSGAAGPLTLPQQTLIDRLAASFAAMLAWIKDLGPFAERATVDTEHSKHTGRIVESDDWHAVQKTGRSTFAIHRLDALDRAPPAGVEVNITYQGGRGTVSTGPDRGDRKGGVGR